MQLTIVGLQRQIQHIEESIKIGEALGKDKSFERSLVREWQQYLPGRSKHHLLQEQKLTSDAL